MTGRPIAVSDPAQARDPTIMPGPSPRRRHSLRRTSSMQSHWPDGMKGSLEIVGNARDLWTGEDPQAPHEVGHDWLVATLTPGGGTITGLKGSRHGDVLAGINGLRPGGQLRKAVAEALPQEPADSTLLYRLIDDMAGATFMSTGGWETWLPGGSEQYYAEIGLSSMLGRPVEGLCVSYAPGSPAMTPEGRTNSAIARRGLGRIPYDTPDAWAWHKFASQDGPNQWRIRYIDLWLENGRYHAEFGFQDSAARVEGPEYRALYHEYRGKAVIRPESFVLEEMTLTQGSLPFGTCLGALGSGDKLVGLSLAEFRNTVLQVLPGTAGCTHLNDALRSLQDVVGMSGRLTELLEAA